MALVAAFILIMILPGAVGDCDSLQYMEIATRGVVRCTLKDFSAVSWRTQESGRSLLLYEDSMRSGDGYTSGEYDIYPNGSLIINNVTLSHETTFTATEVTASSQDFVIHTIVVKTTVTPEYPYPAIEGCSPNQDLCFKEVPPGFTMSCSVHGSRPGVNLTWITESGRCPVSTQWSLTSNSLTYTSNATIIPAAGPPVSDTLCLLVCQAIDPASILVRTESFVLIQNDNHTSTTKPIRKYIELYSDADLMCVDEKTNLVVWKKSAKDSEFHTILFGASKERISHDEDHSDHIALRSTGALSFTNVEVSNEGTYLCAYSNGVTGGEVIYDVHSYALPIPVHPIVEGCNRQPYCILEVHRKGNLTCEVLGIRPAVKINWRVVDNDVQVSFNQRESVVQSVRDTYDISLTSTFNIISNSVRRLTVECRITGEHEELFDSSTRVDMLLFEAQTTEVQVTGGTKNIHWIVIAIGLFIGLLLVLGMMFKSKRSKRRHRTENGDTEEGIHMMTGVDESLLKEQFLTELKSRYQILYDAVQPIPYIKDRMYCVDKVFVEGGIEHRDTSSLNTTKWKPLKSYSDILNETYLQIGRQIVEGEPGYGKSTLTLQLAYDWCNAVPNSPLRNVDIFIFLRLRQMGGVDSIYRAIRQFILPRDSKLTESNIRDILLGCTSLLVVLDGYDEYPDQAEAETDVAFILKKSMFQGANVIVTTRSSYLPKEYAPQIDRIRLTGFGEQARDKYIRKAVIGRDNQEAIDDIKIKLQENPVLGDLCQVPLFFVMFAHMTYEREDFKTFESVTSFFRFMISCFHSHMRNKMKDENAWKYELLENDHSKLDRVAFDALSGENQSIVWNREDLYERLGQEFYDQYIRIGILVEEEVLEYSNKSNVPGPIQYKTEVRFYHQLFCEWYAAHYLADVIASDSVNSSIWLACLFLETDESNDCVIGDVLHGLNPFDLQYMYRFACGLNYAASEKLIEYLQTTKEKEKFAVLCILEQEVDGKLFLDSVKSLVSEKDVNILEGDSRLLQRSSIQLLEVASKHKVPIKYVYLLDVFDAVNVSNASITLRSGLCLPALSTMKILGIQEEGREMTDEEIQVILWFATQCTGLTTLWFETCVVPYKITVSDALSVLRSRNVEVKWDYFTLNLWAGTWVGTEDSEKDTDASKLGNGKPVTDSIYQKWIHLLRRHCRDTKWQKARRGDTSVECNQPDDSFELEQFN